MKNPHLRSSAMGAIKHWKFKTAVFNGQLGYCQVIFSAADIQLPFHLRFFLNRLVAGRFLKST
jgi:hypothetical protein